MNPAHITTIANRLKLQPGRVEKTFNLIAGGATVPFIARYRKEETGSLDEVQVADIRDLMGTLLELDSRRNSILESLSKRDLLTNELQQQLDSAEHLTILEDIYLPHRPKRKTRGFIAKEKGLTPPAKAIFSGKKLTTPPENYFDNEKGVITLEDVFSGARYIIAEWINENKETRILLRHLFHTASIITSKVIAKNKEKGEKYTNYFDWQEQVSRLSGHRLLAMLRGEREKILSLTIRPPEEKALTLLKKKYVNNSPHYKEMELAVTDCYKRLLSPSLENELRKKLKIVADHEAIGVFATNISELLLAPPLGRKRVLALDPGFRTGAKLVCLDEQGKLLHSTTIYPTHGREKVVEAGKTVLGLVEKYCIEAIGIGNGTASRETEQFIHSLSLPDNVITTMVNEDGASIYSASESARKEFPDHDLTVRGAISIGRRLQDPLAELVKIDPKSIGVGQYQHDVDQSELKKCLEDVVVSCVNKVGVEVNISSPELLTHVSGLGPGLADNIIIYRHKNGPFNSRKDLLNVPKLGPKTFEQCAGFLRIQGSTNQLDASGVHPERYKLVEKMAKDAGSTINDLIREPERQKKVDINNYVSKEIGIPTLSDIMEELAKPGRDPRRDFSQISFTEGVNSIDDLNENMELSGIVTNVTKFGAFVDIGVHQDGLVHISQLADRFIKDPNEVVKPRQQVRVRVLSVEKERGRISLSMRKK